MEDCHCGRGGFPDGRVRCKYVVVQAPPKKRTLQLPTILLKEPFQIFAVNMVLPMLEIVYWENKLPPHQETAINLATLVGTIIGQLAFGILADRYGRKKMYGFELLIVIVATVGFALCSKGAQGSINILAWVISWRLLMGIGIGNFRQI
jgi:MFS family permease